MPRGWISRLKQYNDLQICARPTSRGILCDGIRKQNIFQPQVYFLIYKLVNKPFFLEVCKFEKNTSGWNAAGYLAKNIFQPEVFFFQIYKLLKKMVYLEVCKLKKTTSGWNFFFLRIPSPRIPRQVCRVQI